MSNTSTVSGQISTSTTAATSKPADSTDYFPNSHSPNHSPKNASDITPYMDPTRSLQDALQEAIKQVNINLEDQKAIWTCLEPLIKIDFLSYQHSIRVALLCLQIANKLGFDPLILFEAGLLHDCGKAAIAKDILERSHAFGEYNEKDHKAMEQHVLESYITMVENFFEFPAAIAVWHHKFQKNSYPPKKKMPSTIFTGSPTQFKILYLGRLLALADCYDALHRLNGRDSSYDPWDGVSIKKKLIELNPDARSLIERLYDEGVFTTNIYH